MPRAYFWRGKTILNSCQLFDKKVTTTLDIIVITKKQKKKNYDHVLSDETIDKEKWQRMTLI